MYYKREREKERFRIRSMDTCKLERIKEYCEVHDIECWDVEDDGVNPFGIRFITDYETYQKILFLNGLYEH